MNINKDIPIPGYKQSEWVEADAVMTQMQPGDSILIEHKTRGSVAVRAYDLWGKGGYATRKTGEAVRLWRVK